MKSNRVRNAYENDSARLGGVVHQPGVPLDLQKVYHLVFVATNSPNGDIQNACCFFH
jgi:hypothetical protein